MNATPNRLRLFSASLLAVAMLGACTGEFEDAQERAELAADIIEAEMPQLSVDTDALACAIELAEIELSNEEPGWDVPPVGPCPPPTFVTDVTMGTQTANSESGELEQLDPLTEVPEGNGRGTKLEVFEGLGLAPQTIDPLEASRMANRSASLETVPQHPNGLDRPQLRPTVELGPVPLNPDGLDRPQLRPEMEERSAMLETVPQHPNGLDRPQLRPVDAERDATLETVPQHPKGLDRPQLRPVDAELALDITLAPPAYELQRPSLEDDELQTQACVDSCVQIYIVCAAHPDHDLYECADELAECSASC